MNEKITIIELDSLHLPDLGGILRFTLAQYKDEFSIASMNLGAESFDSKRGQYDAQKILYKIHALKRSNDWRKCIGITNQDIFIDGRNFVFGLASPTINACIVSLSRLVEHQIPTPKERERITKEIIHETGHVYGLQHCTGSCVMAISDSIIDIDSKSSELCTKCKRIFKTLTE